MAERTLLPRPALEDLWTYERYLLVVLLSDWARQSGLGKVIVAPLDVVLASDTVVQPDVLFIRAEHLERLTRQNIQGAPDLVVEVLSPGTRRLDRTRKRALYARHGIPECWIVSPEEGSVEVLRLEGERYEAVDLYAGEDRLESTGLPGFSCPARDLFAE